MTARSTLKNALLLSIFFAFAISDAIAQPLAGIKTVCASGCDYPSLTTSAGLFNAINTNGLGGNLQVTINGDLTEDGSVPLNNVTVGSSYTITISPNSATLRTISGSVISAVAPVGMIKIYGADNVTIDGSYLGSGQYLLFRNSSSVTSGGSTQATINFDNSATNDMLTNCIIESNATNGARTPVLINNTGTNTVTVSYCDIRNSTGGATGNPNTALRVNGSSNTVQILNNNIHNFTQNGIQLANAADGCTVSNNSLYSTLTTSNSGITAINITSGSGHTISNNYIGGTAPQCGGTPWVLSSDANFTALLAINSLVSATSVQGNTIQNISLTNAGGLNASFTGMDLGAGSYNVGTTTGNTIGHNTTANSIQVATEGASGTVGIRCNGNNGTVDISNNTIANIRTTSTDYGIMELRGIENTTGINLTISGNTIHSLQSLCNTFGKTVTGIYTTGASSAKSITGNTIYDLEASYISGGTTTWGIHEDAGTTATISRNRIYDLRALSGGGTIIGVNIPSGSATLSNNQVSISNSTSTNSADIRGVQAGSSAATTLYYNTIYVAGSATLGSANSYAFLRTGTGTTNLKDNILFNARTGGTGFHYAIGNTNASPATGWSSNASNYNLLVASNASYTGEWGAGANKDFTGWKTSSASDNNSWSTTSATLNATNMFTAPASGDLNIVTSNPEAWYANGRGVQIAGQTADYGNTSAGRSTTVTNGATDIGSDEFVPTSTPPAPTVTGTIGVGNTQTFTFAGRTLGTLQWTAGSSLPTAITWEYRPGTTPPANLNNHYSNGYWTVTPTGGTTYTYTITLNYDPAMLGTAVEASAGISKKPELSTAWAYLPSSTVNTTNKTVSVSGLTSLSHFTITDNIAPLSIGFKSFTARADANSVAVNWQTENEDNADKYELERSGDNQEYVNLVSYKAKGDNSSYDYKDLTPLDGANYYRVKMTEKSGAISYSRTVKVSFKVADDISMLPNPVVNNLYVSAKAPGDVTVVDMAGRTVITKTITANDRVIDMQSLAPGQYIVHYSGNNQSKTVKITKE